MSWTRAADLRAQVQALWDRGRILADLVVPADLFPQRLVLKVPTPTELTERFDAAREWIAELLSLKHARVELREVRHRILGANAIPAGVWVDTLDAAVAWIGKQRQLQQFNSLLQLTGTQQPELLAWLAKRPLRALELCEDWPRLLAVVDWMRRHPRPQCYLRQIDIAGVHSKFIEGHRAVLAELFDLVLSPDRIDPTATGVSGFAQRYGFCDKSARIRLRLLDPTRAFWSSARLQDLGLDAPSFAQLDPRVSRVFITENEINYLAFPAVPDALLIFGAGYGFDQLKQAEWLTHCQIHYWGDIDTHGFAILDQLRGHFPEARSLLMDRETLLAFEAHWGHEDKPTARDLLRLDPAESALYDDLRDNRLGRQLRLEQERIGYGWVLQRLAAFGAA